jgi:hypothetical protein
MVRTPWGIVIAALAVLAATPPVGAQEPETRAEALRREREKKAAALEQPDPSGLERLLLDLETGRLFERILNPAEGLYPKIGNITQGSGFSLGPAYRKPGLFGGHADFSAFAAASFKKYWMIEGRLAFPRMASERLSADVHAQRYDFPEEDFFGLGPASRREDFTAYGLANTVLGATAAYHPARWFSLGGSVDHLSPSISASPEAGFILSVFTPEQVPGAIAQPDFLRYEAVADLNHREPRGNPRAGGRYALTYHRYEDLDGGLYSFDRVQADVQHYVPLLRDRRVLALRALATVSGAAAGAEVPFYFQSTLGGPDDLRGFRQFRFRDRHALLLQAEYRWEIFTAMDGAIFYDAGKVASRLEDLNFEDLESDYGIGFRFGTKNGVFLRVEGAFGSAGGKHFIMRFGHVF